MNLGHSLFLSESKEIDTLLRSPKLEERSTNQTKNQKNILGSRFSKFPMDLNFLLLTLYSVVCLPMTSRQSQPQWRSSSCQRAPDRIPKQIATVTVYSRHAVGSIYLGHIGPALHIVQSICIAAPTDCAMEMLCTCTVNLIRPKFMSFPSLRAADATSTSQKSL